MVPLLFNIYMTTQMYDKIDMIKYADDTTFISTINTFYNHITGMNNNINQELTNIYNWLSVERIHFKV